jgi:class I lanthipeptide synthase
VTALLDGDDAARARDAVAAICERLDRVEVTRPSLASGAAGLALLSGYRAFAGEPGADEKAHAYLARAIELVDAEPELDPTLGWGITGVGWVMQHLRELVGAVDDALAPIDAMALELVMREGGALRYEHLLGAVGVGVYGLERGQGDLVAAVVARLARTAETTATGITWRSLPRAGGTIADPRGYHDLGVGHGVPGAIAFLARAAVAGVDAARPLCADAVAWLLGHDDPSAQPRFPMRIGVATGEARRGWCYGDLGIACTLVGAGELLGEPTWIARGLAIAHDAASDPIGADMPVTGGFCHGIAGRAHMLARLAPRDDTGTLRIAARAAYRATLDRIPAADLMNDLLAGWGGVAITLLAAISDTPPAWSRAWLLSAVHRLGD